MMKSYEEIKRERQGIGTSMEEGMWNIARELSRKNDLLEIVTLCKTADAIRSAAKCSSGELHGEGWSMAEELALMAHKKITKICGLPDALNREDDDEEEV